MKICIIGTGNVAVNLEHGFGQKHIRAVMHSSRSLADLPEADCYIYAVADQALRDVASQVHAPKALHVHTSGTMPVTVFGEDKPHAGVLYFFQSFSKEQLIEDWSPIPVFIEGRSIDDIAAVYTLAQTFTNRIFECSQAERERLHVAGVFANNFVNLMYSMAGDLLRGTSIPFEVLLPLIDQTAAKVHTLPPREAQTGPAKRNDRAVMAHHVSLLSDDERAVYELLSRLILNSRDE